MSAAKTQREHLLTICRSVMPGVAGVVLATLQGGVVAHEEDRVADPHALVRHASSAAAAPTSALVPHAGGLYLVVFVPAESVATSCCAPA